MMDENSVSTASAVWITIAILHKENPQYDAFRTRQIFQKLKELGLQSTSDETILTHISSHCVANKPAQPDTHRKLYRVRTGWYKLFKKGFHDFHRTRENGQIVPLPEMIPPKFHYLLDWYYKEYIPSRARLEKLLTTKQNEIDPNDPSESQFTVEKIQQGNLIQIPNEVLGRLEVKEGDHLGFVIDQDNSVRLKRVQVRYEIQ